MRRTFSNKPVSYYFQLVLAQRFRRQSKLICFHYVASNYCMTARWATPFTDRMAIINYHIIIFAPVNCWSQDALFLRPGFNSSRVLRLCNLNVASWTSWHTWFRLVSFNNSTKHSPPFFAPLIFLMALMAFSRTVTTGGFLPAKRHKPLRLYFF